MTAILRRDDARFMGCVSGLNRLRKGPRHGDGIYRFSDRCVEQYGVITKLHRLRGVGWRADARIHNQCAFRETIA